MRPNRIETRRQRVLRLTLSAVGYTIGWLLVMALSAAVAICAFFSDAE